MKTQSLLRFPAAVAVLLSALSASAQTTWTGAVSGDWQDDANWSAGAPVANEGIFFSGTTNPNIVNAPSGINLGLGSDNAINFSNITNGQSFTIGGGPINLNGAIKATAVAGGGAITDTISANIVLFGGTTNVNIGANHNLTITGDISGSTGNRTINKLTGTGTLTLSGTNTYGTATQGGTNINAGTLALGKSGVLSDVAAVTLGGGTLALNGFEETMGRLNMSASSIIDLGAGGVANFTSAAATWTGTLTIAGTFVDGASLQFGNSPSGLTATQLSQISIAGFTVTGLNASGFLNATSSAIPEPSTYAALAGLAILGFAASRRRRA